jgi:hypothetical protein
MARARSKPTQTEVEQPTTATLKEWYSLAHALEQPIDSLNGLRRRSRSLSSQTMEV